MYTVFDETNPERLTLVDILRWRAQHEPLREAYAFLLDGETKQVQMTYADLDLQARRIATLLQDCVTAGERVLLLYPPGLEYIAAIFGCFYAGVVAVPAYPPRLNQNLQRIQTILQDAQATAALTTSTILSSRLSEEGPFLRTGDLGFCVDNELFVTGRLKDLIIIRGRNLYPQDIDQVVEKSHPLLRQSCCAALFSSSR